MSDYALDQAVVIWALDEPVEGISQRLIWGLGVRSRPNCQLDTFLKMLEKQGSCTVIIKDPEGNGFNFSCRLSEHALAA